MFLTQKPTAFDSMDLRKYHIRDLKDVIKYLEFVAARNDEATYILKREATRLSTLAAAQSDLVKKLDEERKNIGAPASVVKENKEKAAKIQTVSKTEQQERDELLGELKAAVAEEKKLDEDADEELQKLAKEEKVDNKSVSIGLYRLTVGVKRDGSDKEMWYKNSGAGYKLVSVKEVPESVKTELRDALEG